MRRRALIFAAVALIALPAIAVAQSATCPNCGSTLTDSGRCPYCNPKPGGTQK